MAQLAARPNADQEVAGSTSTGSATFFVEIDHKVISMVILSLQQTADSRRAVFSFWQNNVHNTGKRLED